MTYFSMHTVECVTQCEHVTVFRPAIDGQRIGDDVHN